MNEIPNPTSLIVANEQRPALENSAPKRSVTSPKWETAARERMKAAIKKFSKPLADLVARDANEGDTRLLVTDMLCEGFGFDKYTELTTEYRVKSEFADYGIRLEKDLIAFLEVKRVTTKLAAKHLRQVETYAVNEGVEWVILTSGVVWQVYHITGGLPMVVDLALEVDLFGEGTVTQKANQLYYLTKESLKRRQIDTLWQAKRATSQAVTDVEIVKLLNETVLRPECLVVKQRA